MADGEAFESHLLARSERQSVEITYYDFGVPGTPTKCTLGLGANGTPFVPAAIHPQGSDAAFLRAGLDEVMVGQYKGHLYVPADWLLRQLGGDPHRFQKEAIIIRMAQALRDLLPFRASPKSDAKSWRQ